MGTGRAHLPRQVPIEAYGNGGFRFGGMSHRGSILCLPSGVYGWAVGAMDDLNPGAFEDVLAEREGISLLLLGTGRELKRPSSEIRQSFATAGVGLEPMDTGAAARTYNILLAEGRRVAAALIAVP